MVGGGVFAIPIVSAEFGFLTTFCFVLLSWAIMTKTGLFVLELSLSCPEKYNSYYSIVGKFLGNKIQAITIVLFLWLLYFSLSSYISGCVSVLMSHIGHISPFFTYVNLSLAYVLIFGTLIVISAKIIVRLNVILVILKLGLFGAAITLAYHFYSPFNAGNVTLLRREAFSLVLIIINAFGFQFIVPSLVSYYGRENRIIFKRMLITSTTIVLFLYLAWLYTIYSIISMVGSHGLISIYHSKNQLLAFNTSLFFHLNSGWIMHLLSLFEAIALFGSFLCVALGVFDFLVDVFKAHNRAIIGVVTFLPPLLLTLFSQNMYVYAMSAAGYIAVVLEIIIPTWAITRLTRPVIKQNLKSRPAANKIMG